MMCHHVEYHTFYHITTFSARTYIFNVFSARHGNDFAMRDVHFALFQCLHPLAKNINSSLSRCPSPAVRGNTPNLAVIPTGAKRGTSEAQWSVSPMVWHRPHRSVAYRGDTLHSTAPRRLVAVTVGMRVLFGSVRPHPPHKNTPDKRRGCFAILFTCFRIPYTGMLQPAHVYRYYSGQTCRHRFRR